MASRKEEQARRRAERLAEEQREQLGARRRLMAGYIVAGAMALAIVVGLAIVLAGGGSGSGTEGDSASFPENAHIQALSGAINDYEPDDREGTPPPALEQGDLEAAVKTAGCELQLDLEEEGNTHIGDNPEDAPDYKTSPATTGNHVDPGLQQADGAYAETLHPAYVVHSQEHGRVSIHYSPDLSEDEQLELKGVFDEDPAGMLFFPDPDMPWDVAAAAWTASGGGQIVGCKSYEGPATLDVLRDFRDTYRGQGPESVALVTG